jgi:hypothetical protein
MHLKVFVKLKKALKTLSSGQKKPNKNQKTHWAGFLYKKKPKTRFFSNPDMVGRQWSQWRLGGKNGAVEGPYASVRRFA